MTQADLVSDLRLPPGSIHRVAESAKSIKLTSPLTIPPGVRVEFPGRRFVIDGDNLPADKPAVILADSFCGISHCTVKHKPGAVGVQLNQAIRGETYRLRVEDVLFSGGRLDLVPRDLVQRGDVVGASTYHTRLIELDFENIGGSAIRFMGRLASFDHCKFASIDCKSEPAIDVRGEQPVILFYCTEFAPNTGSPALRITSTNGTPGEATFLGCYYEAHGPDGAPFMEFDNGLVMSLAALGVSARAPIRWDNGAQPALGTILYPTDSDGNDADFAKATPGLDPKTYERVNPLYKKPLVTNPASDPNAR